MRNSFLALAFSLAVLCLGAGAEELLPKVLGVGFPVLLMAAQVLAVRWSLAAAMVFAVAAGGVITASAGGRPVRFKCELNARDLEIILAGGLLNL